MTKKVNLTPEEKELLIACKDESQWYDVCEQIKQRRNGYYPNYLSREILEIYIEKFPADGVEKKIQINRKAFITWLSLGWLAFTAATGGFFTVLIRYLFPNVLFEPPQSFKIGYPEEFDVGKVDTRFKKKHNIWVVRSEQGIYALSTVCTHLGCTPNWLETERKFKCPCHGSGFRASGMHFEGPAPRPLERFRIYLADDGQIIVDKNKNFKYEKGEWERAESILLV